MLVQDGRVGAPLARTACHVMRDEPFSFPPTRPFMGVLWELAFRVFEGTLLRGSGALGSYPPLWRRPPRTQAACTAGALLACSIPDPPPAARAHHCDRVAAGVRMISIFTPLSRRDIYNYLGQFVWRLRLCAATAAVCMLCWF